MFETNLEFGWMFFFANPLMASFSLHKERIMKEKALVSDSYNRKEVTTGKL